MAYDKRGSLGFRFYGFRFRVLNSGFCVNGLGMGVKDSGFKV
jgi:hypothetical protein